MKSLFAIFSLAGLLWSQEGLAGKLLIIVPIKNSCMIHNNIIWHIIQLLLIDIATKGIYKPVLNCVGFYWCEPERAPH